MNEQVGEIKELAGYVKSFAPGMIKKSSDTDTNCDLWIILIVTMLLLLLFVILIVGTLCIIKDWLTGNNTCCYVQVEILFVFLLITVGSLIMVQCYRKSKCSNDSVRQIEAYYRFAGLYLMEIMKLYKSKEKADVSKIDVNAKVDVKI